MHAEYILNVLIFSVSVLYTQSIVKFKYKYKQNLLMPYIQCITVYFKYA